MSDDDLLAGRGPCPAGPDGIQGVDGIPDTPPAPKPKRGRPRCTEEVLGSVTVHLPTTAHDRIIALASARRQNVSEYLRDVMIQLFLRG
jgi:hypothetical protein